MSMQVSTLDKYVVLNPFRPNGKLKRKFWYADDGTVLTYIRNGRYFRNVIAVKPDGTAWIKP